MTITPSEPAVRGKDRLRLADEPGADGAAENGVADMKRAIGIVAVELEIRTIRQVDADIAFIGVINDTAGSVQNPDGANDGAVDKH